METGNLDRQVTLETYTAGRDEYGGTTEEWGSPEKVWANVRFPTAREAFQGDQLTAVQSAVFTIRHREGVTPKMRVILDGLTYNITGVTEPERRRWLQLFGTAENNG